MEIDIPINVKPLLFIMSLLIGKPDFYADLYTFV